MLRLPRDTSIEDSIKTFNKNKKRKEKNYLFILFLKRKEYLLSDILKSIFFTVFNKKIPVTA